LKSNLDDWVSTFSNAYCFVEFPPNYTPAQFDASLVGFVKKHKPAEYQKDGLTIQPFTEIHFDDRFGNFNGRTFSRELITALGLIGIFLLVIACVNFINLATAQAVNRSKEVGVRKVLGSSRKQLVMQFIGETAVITFFAMLLAITIAILVLPLLNALLRVQLTLHPFTDPSMLLFIGAAFVVVTILAGFYPALVLSGFNPINALKSKIVSTGKGNISLRRALVVLQFVIAQVLIIGTLVVVKQMSYFNSADLGFNKDAIINVPFPGDSVSRSKVTVLRAELQKQPGIRAVSFSFASPADNYGWNSDFKYNNAAANTEWGASLKWADTGYFRMYNLQFVAGRMYLPSDTVKEFVVNEKLLERVRRTQSCRCHQQKNKHVERGKSGIDRWGVKDFHSSSLRQPLSPVLMSTWNDVYQTANIQMQQGKTKEVLAGIEKLWAQNISEFCFRIYFPRPDDRGFLPAGKSARTTV
jgi:putative ABC transport system permease protein